MTKVMLLDDNLDTRFLTARILKQLGCTVTEFADVEIALEAIKQQNPFDIIFTDLHMPKISGIEFIEKVKALYPDACIVVTSLTSNMILRQEALDKGAFTCIFEKQDKDTFREVIQRVMHKQ